MQDLTPITYSCPSCGEENETLVDPSGGDRQTYTEDCAVCCRANVIHILISADGEISISVEFEG